jgi:hypothetical protein
VNRIGYLATTTPRKDLPKLRKVDTAWLDRCNRVSNSGDSDDGDGDGNEDPVNNNPEILANGDEVVGVGTEPILANNPEILPDGDQVVGVGTEPILAINPEILPNADEVVGVGTEPILAINPETLYSEEEVDGSETMLDINPEILLSEEEILSICRELNIWNSLPEQEGDAGVIYSSAIDSSLELSRSMIQDVKAPAPVPVPAPTTSETEDEVRNRTRKRSASPSRPDPHLDSSPVRKPKRKIFKARDETAVKVTYSLRSYKPLSPVKQKAPASRVTPGTKAPKKPTVPAKTEMKPVPVPVRPGPDPRPVTENRPGADTYDEEMAPEVNVGGKKKRGRKPRLTNKEFLQR